MDTCFQIINFLQSEQIEYAENVNLKTKTLIKRGGKTRFWVQPTGMVRFEKLVSWCQLNSIDFEVIGNTSNCYFLNEYNPMLIISTLKLNRMKVEKDSIICECGYNIIRFAKHCISKGIAGYEGFIGLPGTVGGAAINNAGCYGSLISDVIKSVTIIQNGKVVELNKEILNYSHRNSALKVKKIEGVLLKVTFDISKRANPEILDKKSKEFQHQRRTFQEHTFSNLGTTFCKMEFKKLPLFKRIINATFLKVINSTIKGSRLEQRIAVKLFWLLHPAGSFRNYVSLHSISCFTWKDEHADQAFIQYCEFIRKNTISRVLEIDVKK